MKRIAIYERSHQAAAWKFNRVTNPEMAQIAKNLEFGGIETLLVPVPPSWTEVPTLLCSTQTQANSQAIGREWLVELKSARCPE